MGSNKQFQGRRSRFAATMSGALLLAVVAMQQTAVAQTSGKADPSTTLQKRLYWALRISKAKPAADEPLYLLIHFSKDCGYCTKWRRDSAGIGNAKIMAGRYPNVRIYVVDRDDLGDPERVAQYPRALLFEYERRKAGGDLSPGVPLFEIFLRGEVLLRASGLDSWVDRVIPAVETIESRREGPVNEQQRP